MILKDENGREIGGIAGPAAHALSDAYHTDYNSGDSHSSLELFRESPAKYAAIRVHRTIQPYPPTPAMKVGQVLHAVLLEYDKELQFVMRQNKNKPGRVDLWNDGRYLDAAKMMVSKDQVKIVGGMLAAIMYEPDAWNLLAVQPGCNEFVFTSCHPEYKMRLKCKPDRLLANGLVVDLKTVDGAVDPLSWSRCLSKWGYHRQAAFYLDVLQAAGQTADMFIFVAVSKDPPHEIGIYVIDEESIEQGRRENRELLERLAECRRSGVWKHDWQGKILTAGVLRWAIS